MWVLCSCGFGCLLQRDTALWLAESVGRVFRLHPAELESRHCPVPMHAAAAGTVRLCCTPATHSRPAACPVAGMLLCRTCAALMMRYVAISGAVPGSSSPSASMSSICTTQNAQQNGKGTSSTHHPHTLHDKRTMSILCVHQESLRAECSCSVAAGPCNT